MIERIAPKAFDLIVRYETGGRKYYEGHYKSGPHWPEGASGVTIGCGYDLGYETEFVKVWRDRLSIDDFLRLRRTIGLRGQQAHQAMSGVRGIVIPWDTAIEVFNNHNLPQYIRLTVKTFPQADRKLSRNAFGALVSLVFNRGGGLDNSDRRREMVEIRQAIMSGMDTKQLHSYIAGRYRSMTRLWKDDPDSDQDLVDRRKDEAVLTLTPDDIAA